MSSSPSPSKKNHPPPEAVVVQPSSPRFPVTTTTPTTSGAHRKIGIAVDLSEESANAVKWAVQNYLRPGDGVILLHVRPTTVLYGADWGYTNQTENLTAHQKLEDEFDQFTTKKVNELAEPLVDGNIPFKVHIVKDHDMKERLCLEVERLGLSAVIMGSRGFGAARKSAKGRLGSVSDYCVHHCVCPVIVVRFPDEGKDDGGKGGEEKDLCAVPEEVEGRECLDAHDKHADTGKAS